MAFDMNILKFDLFLILNHSPFLAMSGLAFLSLAVYIIKLLNVKYGTQLAIFTVENEYLKHQ
jgi:hypothetical protein